MTSRRPLPFVLAATSHGSMIVNRLDDRMADAQYGYGAGYQRLNAGCFNPEEVGLLLDLLKLRRKFHGDGVMALDCGANIGVHTLEWARFMSGWGEVLAFEPQERIYYALAGNIALNNCLNASARWAAVGKDNAPIRSPAPDYSRPASFGSLELRQTGRTEFIGQAVSYDEERLAPVPQVSIDSLRLARLDLLKIDVAGMEAEVLLGAHETLETCRPVVMVQVITSDRVEIEVFLQGVGYRVVSVGINLLAVHEHDALLGEVRMDNDQLVVRV